MQTATLVDERFAALGDSSKIISFYVNLSTIIMLSLTVKSTVSSSAILIKVKSL
jgi:hypothetical protein